jgi:predicted alpha-1,2-mannosidase
LRIDRIRLTCVAGALACALAAPSLCRAGADLAALVDPFVGTAARAGNTFPGAVVPAGMVQFSPVSAHTSSPGGYRYDDNTISGFALTRLSGAGCTNMGDLPVLPLAEPFAQLSTDPVGAPFATFRHAHESASPGRYHVQLDNRIEADLTATLRTGAATFTFPGRHGYLALDAGGGGATRSGISIELAARDEVRGSITEDGFCGGPASPTLHFDVRFDRPVRTVASWGQDGAVVAGVPKREATDTGGLLLGFAGPTVRMKVGVSYVSVANATLNLARESPGWDFARVARDARSAWNRVLGRIEVKGGGRAAARTFYTALYHSLIHPTVASDVNGQFRRRDGAVGRASGYRRLTNISGWDVYRTQMPLLALIEPGVADDLVRSMVSGAAESGSMAKWEYAGVETGTMVGDPAAPIVAGVDAFGDGLTDRKAALAALERAALRTDAGPFMYPSHLVPTDGSKFGPFVERPGLADYISLGYVPYDLREGGIWGTASTTLEYGVADFALSRLARAAADTAGSAAFLRRSGTWRNLLDPASRYIEPRNADGSFLPGYSDVSKVGFVEGNAMQYTWSVPYDAAALLQAIGPTAASARLDSMLSKLNTDRFAPHAWLGNEPSFGMPWLYLWLHSPSRTQAAVRRATTTLFRPSPAGLPGDDDLGALSAWYVWSSLGLYPAIPGVGGLAIGSPTFPFETIHAGQRTISIAATGGGPYVRSLKLDGRSYARTWVALPRRGALDLRFTRARRPQTWGSGRAAAPPSFPARGRP